MSTLPHLSDEQWAVIEAAMEHGSITTVKRFGQPKATVRSLVARGILEFSEKFAIPPRYRLTSYGFELAEWRERLRGRHEAEAQDKEHEEHSPRYWWVVRD